MPRAPDQNKIKAKELFEQGLMLIEIASQLQMPESTIRSWKNRYKWGNCNATRENAMLQKIETQNNIKTLLDNKELTEKQKLFCMYFAKSLNATQSYMKAFGSNYATSGVEASKSLKKPKIIEEVNRLKEERFARAFLRADDIFQKYIDIAFSDITDYMNFGMETVTDETENEPLQERSFNYAHFKDSKEIDGSVVSEVAFSSQGGAKIKLHDKMKALEWLANHMNMATEEQQLKIDKLKQEVNMNSADGEVVQIVDNI